RGVRCDHVLRHGILRFQRESCLEERRFVSDGSSAATGGRTTSAGGTTGGAAWMRGMRGAACGRREPTSLCRRYSAVKLFTGAPVGQLVLIRDVPAEQESELPRLLERRKIPILLEFVGGLVVMLAVVLLVSLLAPPGRFPGELAGVIDAERGDSGMRE